MTGSASLQPTPSSLPRQRAIRAVFMATGAVILTAATYAVIVKGNQDQPTAILTGALALGLFVGAVAVGYAIRHRRQALALGIAAVMLAGEAFALIMTGDRIVVQREATQAAVRTAAGAHRHASSELVKAHNAYEAATRAQITEAAKTGCKQHCKDMLAAAIKISQHDLEKARRIYEANPAPEASGSPLADRLGWQPWVIDLMVAGLLSVAANGLATLLIALGAHGNRCLLLQTEMPANAAQLPATVQLLPTVAVRPEPPQPPKGGARMVATKAAAEADVIRLVARGEPIPGQDALALRWSVHKSTASRWVQDFERRGLVKRTRDGRRNVVRSAARPVMALA